MIILIVSLPHRYLRKVDCSSFFMCLLPVLPLPRAFMLQPQTVLNRQTRQAVCAINQSIFLRCLWMRHRYLRKVDCSSFVMCLILALPLRRGFMLRPGILLNRQTRQAVCEIKQPIFLRCLWIEHRYIRKLDCSSFVKCLLLALPLPRAFLQLPQIVLNRQTRQAVCAINQSIIPRCLWIEHSYLWKVNCSSFVVCLLLALPFPRAFLQQPLTVLNRQTRQVVRAINQSVFLRCLWIEHRYLRKEDCTSCAMCLLLVLPLPRHFCSYHEQN